MINTAQSPVKFLFAAVALAQTDDEVPEECKCHSLQNPNIVLGMFLWAVFLTVIVIIMLVLTTRRPEDWDRWYYAGSQ